MQPFISKFSSLCTLCFIILSFSSCFELREEIDLNKDGSGTYRLLLDMSQSKSTIDLAQKMQANKDQDAAKNLNFTVDSTFAKSVMRFNNMPGITQARDTVNKTDYIFGITFNFSGMEALNNAMMELNKDENKKSTLTKPVYSLTKNVFEKQNIYYLNNISEALKTKNNSQEAEQMRRLLESATYVTILKVNGKIKKFSNDKAEIDYTKTVLRLSNPLLEVIADKADVGNTVKIK